MQWKRRLAIGVLSLGILVGCATTGEQMATKEKSLYDRLGGKPAITAVVDDFVARVAADRRINRFFANTDVPPFKAKLVDQMRGERWPLQVYWERHEDDPCGHGYY